MKNATLLKFLAITVVVLYCISCNIDGNAPEPGISIYKTKADYFENAIITIKKDSSVNLQPTYEYLTNEPFDSSSIYGQTYFGRVKLTNGYVLDYQADYHKGAYLKITIPEYRKLMKENFDSLSSKELILDADPYVEFYYDSGYPKYTLEDTAKINDIIRNGELDVYFERFK